MHTTGYTFKRFVLTAMILWAALSGCVAAPQVLEQSQAAIGQGIALVDADISALSPQMVRWGIEQARLGSSSVVTFTNGQGNYVLFYYIKNLGWGLNLFKDTGQILDMCKYVTCGNLVTCNTAGCLGQILAAHGYYALERLPLEVGNRLAAASQVVANAAKSGATTFGTIPPAPTLTITLVPLITLLSPVWVWGGDFPDNTECDPTICT